MGFIFQLMHYFVNLTYFLNMEIISISAPTMLDVSSTKELQKNLGHEKSFYERGRSFSKGGVWVEFS